MTTATPTQKPTTITPAATVPTPAPTQEQTNPQVEIVAVTIDGSAIAEEIARTWKWILFGGIVSVIAGICALIIPGFTTAWVGVVIAATLLVAGCVNICGIFYREKGMKLESFLIGLMQSLMAAVMTFYPFSSLAAMTATIGVLFLIEGAVRMGFAISTRSVKGWGWALFGGMTTATLGVLILAGLPFDAFFVIGILVGVNLISNGIARIAIAWEGRSLAKAAS